MADIDWKAVCDEALGQFEITCLPPEFKLPALPHAVSLFLERSSKADADLKQLATIIETDSGLSVELLRQVNSSHMGLRNKARAASQALAMLGLRQSRMFVMTTGMQAAVLARQSKLINQNRFWNVSLEKALFAKQVAVLLKADQDLAFAGSLMQDYLLPILTNELFDAYVDFFNTREKEPINMWDFERAAFGWDHALAGACLARGWKFPDELVACILYHHHGLHLLAHPQLGQSAAAAVALSGLLPDQLRQCHQGLSLLLLLEQKWPAFKLQEIAAAVDAQRAEMGMGVQNHFPLSRRCQQTSSQSAAMDSILTSVAM